MTLDTIERVQRIIRKEGLKTDAAVQTHEDALCLVFLETQLVELVERLGDDKSVDVIAKTLRKMSQTRESTSRPVWTWTTGPGRRRPCHGHLGKPVDLSAAAQEDCTMSDQPADETPLRRLSTSASPSATATATAASRRRTATSSSSAAATTVRAAALPPPGSRAPASAATSEPLRRLRPHRRPLHLHPATPLPPVSAAPVVNDPHGLGIALGRLGGTARRGSKAAAAALGVLLGEGEVVEGLVAGQLFGANASARSPTGASSS